MKPIDFIKTTGKVIVNTIKTKTVGFYIALLGWLLTIAYTITYSGIDKQLYNPVILTVSIIAIILFVIFSLFKTTSCIAPVCLLVASLISLAGFVSTDGMIDYLSTEFFDGLSLAKIVALPIAVWFSVVGFLLTFIISSVTMYIPQNKISKNLESKEIEGGI